MPYRCIKCSSPLQERDGRLACSSCGASFEVKDGVPLFGQDRYWGKISAKEMEEALNIIDTEGWDTFKKKFGKRLDVAFDESRADWRFEVPLTSDWTVLDCGAGLGRNTIPLARSAKRVVAFDQSVLRAQFIKRLATREGLTNVDVFIGDIFDLPLAPKSFDLIAMNGVLEWVGKTDRFKDPREAQIAALKICKNLLKDGGYLYVGIENRYSFVYMRGTDHGDLMYTSFMPRVIADWYNNLRKGEPYQTYTHSKSEYARLFKDAGFSQLDFYLPYPGYNLPRIIVPYEDQRALRFMLTRLTSARRGMLAAITSLPFVLRIYRYFFFSFNIIGRV